MSRHDELANQSKSVDPQQLKKLIIAENGDKESDYDNDDFEREDMV